MKEFVEDPVGQLKKQLFRGEAKEMSRAGCTCGELRRHIEMQFKPGMCWENYGQWVLDHITPRAFFTSGWKEEKALNHYSNLQPLWFIENCRKSDRMGKLSARAIYLMKHSRPVFCNSGDIGSIYPCRPYDLVEKFCCGGFVK